MALTPYICKRVFFQNKWSTFQHGGGNTLDLILTNMKIFYEPPTKRPPFGLSDHMSVEIQPRSRAKLLRTTVTIKSRNLRSSNCLAVRLYLQSIDVSNMIGKVTSCERKVSLLETIIKTGLDAVSPVRAKRVCTTEPPWITASLKQLIKDRQTALSLNNLDEFKRLRNRVNWERKACRAKYYRSKVQYLKNSKPSIWWRELKKLSGLSLPLACVIRFLSHYSYSRYTGYLTNCMVLQISSTKRSCHRCVALLLFPPIIGATVPKA